MSDDKINTTKRISGLPDGHIGGLDGLRAIAVIGVLLYHLFPDVIKGGFLGVSLFFVITGYLLTVTSERSSNKGNFTIKSFYKKRIVRIYPTLLLVVFLTVGVLKVLAPEVLNGIWHEICSIVFGYNNIWQVAQNSSYFAKIANASPFTHLWFLSLEMQFYVLWPFIFLLYQSLRKSRLKAISDSVFIIPAILSVVALILLFKPGEDATRVYYGTDTRVFSLFFGAFIGAHQKNFRNYRWSIQRRVKNVICFIGLMLITLVCFVFMEGQADFTYRIGLIATSIIFCFILKLAVNPQLPIGKFLDCKLLSGIGKISYEIYLCQFPVIFLFQYFKLVSYYYVLLMIGVILVLSTVLHFIISVATGKNIVGNFKIIKVTFIAIVVAIIGFGVYCTVTAPDTKKDSQERLRKELEINSKILEEQTSTVNTSSSAPNSNSSVTSNTTSNTTSNATSNITSSVTPNTTTSSTSQSGAAVIGNSYKSITAVGDSVMLGAVPSIKKAIPDCIIDAKESRQVNDSQSIFDSLNSRGKLGDIVIVGLGTNGPFDLSTGQKIINSFGKDRLVYWITAYGKHLQWQDKTNSVIYELAEKNSNVIVIDWAKEADSHSEWFYDDGIHLSPEGQQAYADLILRSIPVRSNEQKVNQPVTDIRR